MQYKIILSNTKYKTFVLKVKDEQKVHNGLITAKAHMA